MPYIREDDRDVFDHAIAVLQDELREVDRAKRKGAANYVLSRIALGAFNDGDGIPGSYHDISDAISALRDAADEIARRVMGPREDVAIEANGDLLEYVQQKTWNEMQD